MPSATPEGDSTEHSAEIVGRVTKAVCRSLVRACLKSHMVPWCIMCVGKLGYVVISNRGAMLYARPYRKKLEFTTDPKLFSNAWGKRVRDAANVAMCDPYTTRSRVRWRMSKMAFAVS